MRLLVCLLAMGGLSVAEPKYGFPLGVFADAHVNDLSKMVKDLEAKGAYDSVIYTNLFIAKYGEALKGASNRVKVYVGPTDDLYNTWYCEYKEDGGCQIEPNEANARKVATDLLSKTQPYPNVAGFYLKDEPDNRYAGRDPRLKLITQAFKELDTRPAFSVLIGKGRAEQIFRFTQPDVMVLDVYPFAAKNAVGDFTMRAFGYRDDYISYIRSIVRTKPPEVALWLILQAHAFEVKDDGSANLRQPTLAEARAQLWMALGEGAKGIFWFVYEGYDTDLVKLVGLKENPVLFAEVTQQMKRVEKLRGVLGELERSNDQFGVAGRNAYISTLQAKDGSVYVMLVNRDCEKAQELRVNSRLQGRLKDVETGREFALGEGVELGAGEGKLFKLIR